ncbi:MAG: c-type cytochrome [Verrucomicrobia bacterium]|nr:c-type cytochrome [Verrucomicrobiota bacterium]
MLDRAEVPASIHPMRRPALLTLLLGTLAPSLALADGADLYRIQCSACHGPEGKGIPGVFPPLAGADFLRTHRVEALRAPMEGLQGPLTVNGQTYQGQMPAIALKDAQLVELFNFIFMAWGNALPKTDLKEIAEARAGSRYPTFEQLVESMCPTTLPPAPEGWQLRVALPLKFNPTRVIAHPNQRDILMLAANGDVWRWDQTAAEPTRLFAGADYLDASLGGPACLGLGVDRRGRLYVVSNQCNKQKHPVTNEVTIFRAASDSTGGWAKPTPWLRTSYPFGVGPYNHGASHIEEGPDGFLYVSNGARTDGNEAGQSDLYYKGGEVPLTAALWRLDPEAAAPTVEIFARGLRNTYHFTWDHAGRLLGVENGPDADAPEELNVLSAGGHYGFPYQFSDWDRKAYPHSPDVPTGLTITRPFRNVGPDALGADGPTATFTPHSSPSAVIELGADWPAPLGGQLLVARFGNLISASSGYDVLRLKIDHSKGTAETHAVLRPLGRPISLVKLPGHRLLIAEYTRGTTLGAGLSTPGRLLILEPK